MSSCAKKLRSPAKVAFALALSVGALHAGDGGNKQAKNGVSTAFGLVKAGSVDLTTALALPVPPEIKIPLILNAMSEMDGGNQALANNKKTDQQTQNPQAPSVAASSVATPGSDPGIGLSVCKADPTACQCKSGTCKPTPIDLPPLDAIKSNLKDFNGDSTNMPGTALDSALTTLDTSYKKAQQAADAYNQAVNGSGGSLSGTNLPKGATAGDELASKGKPKNAADGDDGIALGTGGTEAGSDTGAGSSHAVDLSALMKSTADTRGARGPVVQKGMNQMSGTTGKALTLFQRCTRAIRGRHDRDLLLAKLEMVRRDFLRKSQLPNASKRGPVAKQTTSPNRLTVR